MAEPRTTQAKIEANIDRTIEAVIEKRIETAAARLGGGLPRAPQREVFVRPTIKAAVLTAPGVLVAGIRDDGPLRRLLANPPRLRNLASTHHDGRKVPIAIVVVRGPGGSTRGGIEVRLRDRASDRLLDRSSTSRSGVAVLRFPQSQHAGGDRPDLVLELADGSQPLALPPPEHAQHRVAEVTVENLEDLPADLPLDDPFGRLPSDFTTEVCDALAALEGRVPDPLFGGLAPAADFRSERSPLLKEVSVVRLGPEADPKRYLVRLRQIWTFRGYTLGELADVSGLDPGAVLNQSLQTVQQTTESVARNLERFLSNLLETTSSSLSERASVDSLIRVATSVDAVGGFAGGLLPLPIPILGGIGGIGVDVSARTRTSIDTSLDVNSRLQFARSLVNEGVRTAMSTLRSLESTLQRTLQQVSPLLSRVTNLLRWVVYENYVVCSHVDDVHEIEAVPLLDLPDPGEPVFPPEDIVRYRPFFEPALLDRTLRPQFDVLRRALEAAANANTLSSLHVAVVYSAVVLEADLRVTVGGRESVLSLRPTSTFAQTTLRIPPTRAADLGTARFSLSVRMPSGGGLSQLLAALADSAGVTISEIRFWFDRSPAADPEQVFTSDVLPAPLTVDLAARTAAVELDLAPPVETFDPADNPLFRHVTENRSYYLGILGQAALKIPSLRFDAPQLADVPPDVWRLPIVGFEGHRIVVIRDADPDDEFVRALLNDPGAGTRIQIAAPGAYAEALQGLLSLTDAVGKIHPSLQPPLAPVMPPLALVDLTGKTLEVVDGGGTGGTGGGGLPIPVP
jgi:hypothetical protein